MGDSARLYLNGHYMYRVALLDRSRAAPIVFRGKLYGNVYSKKINDVTSEVVITTGDGLELHSILPPDATRRSSRIRFIKR